MKEEDRRPDSEQLLRSIQNADGPPGGRLKIFFGYAAGVGKTYAMLEAAHHAKSMGADVVAGYIEPHTRPETQALLEGLERLPPRRIPYKGIQLQEFDLDGPWNAAHSSYWWMNWLIPTRRAVAISNGIRISKSCSGRGSTYIPLSMSSIWKVCTTL